MRVSNGRAKLSLAGDHPFVRHLGGCGREPHIDPSNIPLFARGEVNDQGSIADKLTGKAISLRDGTVPSQRHQGRALGIAEALAPHQELGRSHSIDTQWNC